MTQGSGPSDKAKRNQRTPELEASTLSEVNKEITGLRKALDEHLRGIDEASSRAQAKVKVAAEPAYQYDSDNGDNSLYGGSDSNQIGVIFLCVVSGLVLGLGIGVTIYIGNSGEPPQPQATNQESLRLDMNAFSATQPKQTRSASSLAPAAAERPSDESVRSGNNMDSSAQVASSPDSSASGKWQTCLEQERRDADPPQPGETWWPVVGTSDSLDDARRHCRADAFINRSGNAQIASFRDRETALAFAEQLTQDSSHPWRFWVGDPSVR